MLKNMVHGNNNISSTNQMNMAQLSKIQLL